MDRGAVLVTGAAGTVGTYVVEQLVRSGRTVIATDRAEVMARASFDVPSDAAVERRPGDLTELGFCLDVVAGAAEVIHCAATIDLSLSIAQMRRINVETVKYLYEAARKAGVRRFVFLSSGSIYKKMPRALDEQAPIEPHTPYEQSKHEAEQYLWSRPRDGGPEVVVLRPSMIYGPRARMLGAKLATLPPILDGILGSVPRLRGGAVCNWVHAEDVARAAAFLVEHPKAAWEAFNVADRTPTSFGDVLATVASAFGYRLGAEVPLPTRLLEVVGPLVAESPRLMRALSWGPERAWARLIGREKLVPAVQASLDREVFLYAGAEVIFDTTKLRGLGFEVRWPSFADGYPSVAGWYLANRWVSGPRLRGARVRGLGFHETMAGTWRRTDARTDAMNGESDAQGAMSGTGMAVALDAEGDRPFQFTVAAEADHVGRLTRDGTFRLAGTLDAAGLATGRRCEGVLQIAVGRPAVLAYDLAFSGDDGAGYRFVGEKNVWPSRLLSTITTLPGQVLDNAGRVVGVCALRFDLRRDLVSWLRSFHLTGHLTGHLPAADAKIAVEDSRRIATTVAATTVVEQAAS